ncbi:MAG: hypothetical protein V4603_03095 [Pseudomonadota bacterium]
MDIRNITLLFALSLPAGTFAQTEPLKPSTTQDAAEEILVIGNRSLLQLRMQLLDAEKETYNIFNRVNDEDRFDISCSLYQPTGSRLASQVCEPNFVMDAQADHGAEYLEGWKAYMDEYNADKNYAPRRQPATAVIARQQKEYRAQMKKVAEESPEFLQALIKYSEMRKEYEAATGKVTE